MQRLHNRFHNPFLLLLATAMLTASACKDNDTIACKSTDECPAGHACVAERCEQICANDLDCSAGKICVDELCAVGQRATPVISNVQGNSSETCVLSEQAGATSPTGPCIADGFVVTGENLAGASFSLEGAGIVTLEPVGAANDSRVELTPLNPSLVLEGEYTLVAANQSGSGQSAVKLLRGEQGPQGIDGKLIYIVGSAGVPDERSIQGDRLHVVINTPGTSRLLTTELTDLCDDEDGCTVSIAAGQWPVHGNGFTNPPTDFRAAPWSGPPCRVWMRGSNWSVSNTCVRDYAVVNRQVSATTVTGAFTPYFGATYGVDNDDSDPGPFLMNYEFGCVLSDAPPNFTGNTYDTDTAGFHFFMVDDKNWASGDAANVLEDWLAGPGPTCELTVED